MREAAMLWRRFTVGGYPINGYLAADPETHLGAFIDPGGFEEEIAAFIEENRISLRYLLFTHGHWDHTEGIEAFRQRYSVKGYAGAGEVKAASEILHGGETIELGRLRLRTLSTPGHTPGGITYVGDDCAFTGDALFCGSVGGTANAEDAARQLAQVRSTIFTLPDETRILPAHGPMSTVAAEKYGNPFFRR